MTFAHEVGHNLGAEHDEDAGCKPGYIMSKSGSTKESHHDQQFSTCSIDAIHEQLKKVRKLYGRSRCFRKRLEVSNDQDFSGNSSMQSTLLCDKFPDYPNANIYVFYNSNQLFPCHDYVCC